MNKKECNNNEPTPEELQALIEWLRNAPPEKVLKEMRDVDSKILRKSKE